MVLDFWLFGVSTASCNNYALIIVQTHLVTHITPTDVLSHDVPMATATFTELFTQLQASIVGDVAL